MLYSEFVAATGCKENEHNYKVYRDLEVMYTNSDISKAEIYEYGKKLVDNSKTEREIEIEESVKTEIERYKQENKELRKDISWRKEAMAEETSEEYREMWKSEIKWRREQVRRNRNRIKALEWVLA